MFLFLRHWTVIFVVLAGVAFIAAAQTRGPSEIAFRFVEAGDGVGEANSTTILALSDEQRTVTPRISLRSMRVTAVRDVDGRSRHSNQDC